MDSDDLRTQARALRAAGNTPKQIARALGVPRAKVTALVRGAAAESPKRTAAEPKPLVGCWITRQWSNGLTIEDRPADWIDDEDLPPLAHGAGLANVTVVREHDNTDVSVCGFLVDTYCLGVKNATAPCTVNRRHLPGFLAEFYAAYPTDPLAVPLELAQDLVFGAVEYARTLGFDPHPDFRQAAPQLGAWQPPGRITFGHHGKPFFQQGPYDNPVRILRTLERTAGPGNYHHSIVIPGAGVASDLLGQ
ncbi:helix-turn-helix domain-containing protein [Phytohabitans suffuscus]|uniref:Uncharacterized protein n=1 Tax=Phytohabitans suffuscus TaxID=624315 RepID=A0A6F8YJA4_9ACTN|nr:hypothetical protein [Phytohabitans suffuscus]BCB86099.1 hypothetical protein Psuf_034120 [Phytohabitans suffuscus]